jgi:hypothetical protein
MMLSAKPVVAGKLGKGIDFNGNNQAGIEFLNPLSGSGPSTITASSPRPRATRWLGASHANSLYQNDSGLRARA